MHLISFAYCCMFSPAAFSWYVAKAYDTVWTNWEFNHGGRAIITAVNSRGCDCCRYNQQMPRFRVSLMKLLNKFDTSVFSMMSVQHCRVGGTERTVLNLGQLLFEIQFWKSWELADVLERVLKMCLVRIKTDKRWLKRENICVSSA